ncbi:mental retardation GTPase activating protein [Thalictrum thalictroides]|uniref:Mental retardation GTPase activating protein n=1 Tax=Thalictrum thalictroides TaxID=46969 RepID=A0A7J6UUW8_THATH|nr:mental retardation GTPase activating protein [Thalictrum thalictroides]
MEQQSLTPQCHYEPDNFSLKNWAMKATISRDNTKSRRYSASNIRSFREESFRSTTTISSTVSSPGYTFGDEIDPSTYTFTTALRALQARSGYGWEWLSPVTGSLSSKWNEAEKYICNPLPPMIQTRPPIKKLDYELQSPSEVEENMIRGFN